MNRAAFVAIGAVALACALTGCSARSATPSTSPSDPFAAVAQQSDAAYAEGMARYEEGNFREALDAFERARLLSPTDDPRIREMIQRASAELTPTPTAVPPTVAPTEVPTLAPTAVDTPLPATLVPTPLPASPTPQAQPAQAAPPAPVPAPPAPRVQPTPRPVPPPQPVAPAPLPAPTPTPTAVLSAVTTFVAAGPAAFDVLDTSDQLFIADRSGLIWTLEHGQPELMRPFSVSGTPVGLAADPGTRRLFVAVHAQPPAIVELDAATGQQLDSVALPADPGDVRVDSGLGLLFVLLPEQDAVETLATSDLKPVRSTQGLAQVTGMALDQSTHLLFLSLLGGQLAVLDAQTGSLTRQMSLTDTGLAGIATAGGRVFAVNAPGQELIEVDIATSEIGHLPVAAEPQAVVVSPQTGGVYVLDGATQTIVKLDPANGAELNRVFIGDAPDGQLQPDNLWVRPRMVVSGVPERIYVIEPQAATLAAASFLNP